jgi:biopolymer transport protein TolR
MAFGRGITATDPATGGGGRATGAGGQRPLSDINVTPLVDVMLVLVVIFIVTAPLMASAIRVDLPRADAGRAATAIQPPQAARLSVNAQGALFLDDQPVDETALVTRLAALGKNAPDTEVQLRADRTVPYGRIVELMALAGRAGLTRIGFVAEASLPTSTPPR